MVDNNFLFKKTKHRFLSISLALLMSLSLVKPLVVNAGGDLVVGKSDKLEIYPKPHSMVVKDEKITLPSSVNVVVGKGVDETTLNRLKETLTKIKVNVSVSDKKVDNIFNIYLEVKANDNESKDLLAKNQVVVDDSKIDAHALVIDKEGIAIVGEDTESVFYGVTSFKHVVSQKGKDLPKLVINDYANTKIRGFIEGYYGIPWSNENRMSLMNFGGDFKANAYIFAPKDDPYHSKQWRKLYPADQIAKIKEMAKVGNDTKTRFVWTIHPFMGEQRFNSSDVDGEIKTLIAKFEQLYSAGIRQFGVLGDDVGALDKNIVIKLMTKVSEWGKEKGDVKDFVFCPASYNSGWAWNQSELDAYEKGFPKDVQIFWTGTSTCTPVANYTVQPFKTKGLGNGQPRRDPLFWLNWPVNDVDMSKVFLGPGSCLEKGTTNLAGVVTNPMQEAQASKIAIFAVADFAWNSENFDYMKSWKDSLVYIEPNAYQELEVLGTHMTDPLEKGIRMKESDNIAAILDVVKNKINQNKPLGNDANILKGEMNKIIKACNDFLVKSKNKGLVEELKPFIGALKDRCLSINALIDTQLAIESKNVAKVWEKYSSVLTYNDLATSYHHKKLVGYEIAKPAGQRIQPFFEQINKVIATRANQLLGFKEDISINESTIISEPKMNVYTADKKSKASHFNDYNDSTLTWFDFGTGHNSYEVGSYVGLDLGQSKELNTIHLAMGHDGAGSDIWTKYQVKVSDDKKTWKEVSDIISQSNPKQVTDIDLRGKGIKARYLAVFNLARSNKWLQISELHATYPQKLSLSGFTNVEAYRHLETKIVDNVGSLDPIKNIKLRPNEYIGIDLTKIKDVTEIDVNKVKGLILESSINGIEWEDEKPVQSARYVRLINKTKEDITFDLDKFVVTSFDILPKKVLTSTYSSGNLDNPLAAFDGDLTTPAWYKESQHKGKSITYDLGQVIDLTSIKMAITEGEHDFIRHGVIEVSSDNKTWHQVLKIGKTSGMNEGGNDGSIDALFPVLKVPYRYLENRGFNHKTRYIRISLTDKKYGDDKWVRFQELILNDGATIKDSNNPGIESSIEFIKGFDKEKTADKKLNTYFKADKAGSLIYHLRTNSQKPSKIKIYKDNNTCLVEGRSITGWQTLANSKDEYLEIDLTNKDIYDLKISWQGKIRINEIMVDYIDKDKTVFVDNKSKVIGVIDDKLVKPGYGMDVNSLTADEFINKAPEDKKAELTKLLTSNDADFYEINLNEYGKTLKYNDKLSVILPVKDKLTKVLHIHNGKLVEYQGVLVLNNKGVMVEVDGLSPFAVVYQKPTNPSKPLIMEDANKKHGKQITNQKMIDKKKDNKSKNKINTGDDLSLITIIGCLISFTGFVLIYLRKKESL